MTAITALAPVVRDEPDQIGKEAGGAVGSSAAGPSRSRPKHRRAYHRLIGVVLFFGGWAVLTFTGVIDEHTLANPAQVWTTAVDLTGSGDLQEHLWVSLQRVLWGLAFGITIGAVLAVAAGLSKIGESVIDGPVQILRALPILALQPLFVLWFGIGEEMKVILIAFAVVFPIYINTYAGVTGVDQRYVELSRSVGLTRRSFIRRVVLPGATPSFLVGLRYALAISWLVLILSEGVNATSGLGYLVNKAGMSGQTAVIVLTLAIYGVLGLLSDLLVRLAERRLLGWRQSLGSAV